MAETVCDTARDDTVAALKTRVRQGDAAGACDLAAKLLAAAPEPPPAGLQRLYGRLLLACGDAEAARTWLAPALAGDGDAAPADWLAYARACRRCGADGDAAAAYAALTEADPGDARAQLGLGQARQALGDVAGARWAYEAAVAAAPTKATARAHLAGALNQLGVAARARRLSRQAVAARPIVSAPARRRAAFTVLAPVALGSGSFLAAKGGGVAHGGSNNITSLLDNQSVTRHDVYLDGLAQTGERPAWPGGDVLYNAIAEPDGFEAPLKALAAQLDGLGLPVVNHPARVRAATRDGNYGRLAGLDGVVSPATVRVAVAGREPARALAEANDAAGLGYPAICRPVGYQQGKHMALLNSPDDLPGALAPMPAAAEFYLIAYQPFGDRRGWHTKYRALVVGDRLFPVHAFTVDDWNVHGKRYYQLCRERDDVAAPEQAWLADPEGAIGRARLAALARVAEAVGLDYFGIDFAWLPDGDVLVFEANATMRNRYLEPGTPHMRANYAGAALAFNDLLAARAGRGDFAAELPVTPTVAAEMGPGYRARRDAATAIDLAAYRPGGSA